MTGGAVTCASRYWEQHTGKQAPGAQEEPMQWWDSYRAVYGTELRAEAMVLADHG
jgi:hypothetical protein